MGIPPKVMTGFEENARRSDAGSLIVKEVIEFVKRRYGTLHTKFAASSVLPLPLYTATCGYGHSGRVRSTTPSFTRDARIISGALPFSTHYSIAVSISKWSVPSLPLQWPMPGTMNRR